MVSRGAESSFSVGLRLRAKVGHRLLNLCDCDSVLSEQTDKFSIFKKIIIPHDYEVT